MQGRFYVRMATALACLLLLIAAPAHAANFTWSGASSVSWATTGNWTGGTVPGTGDTAVFGGTATTNDLLINIGSGVSVNTILFSGGTGVAHSITAGSGSITLDDGGTISYSARTGGSPQNQTISRPIVLSGSATFSNFNATGNSDTLSLNGAITGSGVTTVTGSNAYVSLGADNTSTFTGSWVITSGVLSVGAGGSSLGNASSVKLDGGTLRLATAVTASRPITWAKSGIGISFAGSPAGVSGDITMNASVSGTISTGGGNTSSVTGRILGDSTNTVTVRHGGSGEFTLGGAASNTMSGTTVFNNGGTFVLAKTGSATAIAGNLTITTAGEIVRWDQADQIADTSVVTNNVASTLRLNGKSDAIGGLVSTSTGSVVENERNATTGTLTLSVASGTSYTFAGILRNGTSGTPGVLAIGMAGSGTQVFSGSNTFTGGATIQGGVLQLGHASALGTGSATISAGTLNLGGLSTVANPIVLSGGTLANGTVGVAQVSATSGAISASLTGAGGLSKSGGGTLALSGSNDFSGGTTLAGGGLAVNATRALGIGTFTITSGTLDNTSGGAVAIANANAQAWNGNFTFAGSANLDLGGGSVTLGGDRTVTVSASTLTVGGSIGGGFGLTKAGAGTLALGGTNGYSGATVVNGGTLSLLAASAVPATSAVTLSAGVLDISAVPTSSVTLASLAGSSGAVLAMGTKNITVGGAANTTFSGGITGSGGLTKQGTGSLLLDGANSYTGATTVSTGTFSVNGSIASTSLSVAAGATLMGSGSIAGATTILGAHMPGNSPGIETFGDNLSYSGGASSVTWELWGNTATQGSPTALYDQIIVGGNLDFAGSTTLDLLFSSGGNVNWNNSFWDTDHQWVVYDVTGTTTNLGNFVLAPTNWADASNNLFQTVRSQATFSISQSGNDVVLSYVVVPEPSSLAVSGIGAALACWTLVRRRSARGRR
jgi:fibronectin-binding autotransporter adhesin